MLNVVVVVVEVLRGVLGQLGPNKDFRIKERKCGHPRQLILLAKRPLAREANWC